MGLKSNSLKNLINKYKENEILSKGSSAFVFKIIGSFFGYLFLLLVTRTSGSEAWGVFALCMALLNITSILSRFGVDIALLRFVAQFKGKMGEVKGIYFQGISLVLFLSTLFSVLLFLFSDVVAELVFRKPQLTSYFKVIAFTVIPFTIIHINTQTYRGLKRIKEFAFFQDTSKFLFTVIIFAFLFYCIGIESIIIPIYSFMVAVLIVMIISSYGLLKIFKGVQLIKNFSQTEIIKTSFPMMLSSSVLLLMAWSDTIMIGIFKTEADVGVYNVALKLAMVTGIVLGAVNSIVAPKLSETFNNNRLDEFRGLIKQSTRIIFFCTIPILIILFLVPEFLLSFFGTEFMIAKTTLLILLVGQVGNAMSGSVGYILQMTGKEKIVQNILLITLIINILLNLFFIPKYGIEGAAFSSAFSLLFWNFVMIVFVKRYYKIYSIIH